MKTTLVTGLVAGAIAIATSGAACGAKTSSAGASAGAPSAVSSDSSTGTKVVTITDPNLNMRAYSLTIPSNWVFQGAVMQGTPCVPGPFPIIRMSSPDGLTGLKELPRLDWAWSDNPRVPPQGNSVCLDYKKDTPASEVLKYMVGVLRVEFVKEEPVPWLANAQQRSASQSTPNHTSTVDIAIATVRYHINSIQIDEHLKVFVGCDYFRGGPSGGQHYCSAQVIRQWAPQGRFSADVFSSIERSFAIDQQWNQRWNAEMTQKIKEVYAAGNRLLKNQRDQVNARMAAQQNAFNQAQDMHQRQHDEFLATMKRGTDLSMQQAGASAKANHQMAGDWADYSLDQQKRLDPTTGRITKDSSAYSYTWVNDSDPRNRMQTNDVNFNPNGNGTGNWTLQQNVR